MRLCIIILHAPARVSAARVHLYCSVVADSLVVLIIANLPGLGARELLVEAQTLSFMHDVVGEVDYVMC